jgi:hypothetical protein
MASSPDKPLHAKRGFFPFVRGSYQDSPPESQPSERWAGFLVVVALFLLGMALVPLSVTGFDLSRMPGDEGDGYFNACVLEHGWQWLSGQQSHFWDAPFYYPQPNVIAYSDCHLGTLPLYAAFRLLGLDRETSFQGWFLLLFAANYLILCFGNGTAATCGCSAD